jgi:hypothetical protein
MPVPQLTAIVALRTTPAAKALYRATASLEGMRLSTWVRSLIERRLRELGTDRGARRPRR